MTQKLFLSKNIVLENDIIEGGILVNCDGKIISILDLINVGIVVNSKKNIEIIDVDNYVIMPGIIDAHVHVNEPGRTNWEGFETATKAAAAGGVTTIADMPLNSIPPTTTLENLKIKLNHAKDKIYVDVAFWGGLVPENHEELLTMVKYGVVGFKCFLCPSGVDEFNAVSMGDVERALQILENCNTVLAFHAEIEESPSVSGNCTHYKTFLNSRPDSMEINAIKNIIELSDKYNVPTHIVHLSSADALPLIKEAKKSNSNLTVETCYHYITISSEDIPEKATQFKCCPPIRDSKNRERLWAGLKGNLIDMIVSDHSPCTAELKLLSDGDFIKAWGGISSLQFGLSLLWTEGLSRGLTILDIKKYLCETPAKLIRLHKRKGKIAENYDADFVIWDPNATVVINEPMIQHRNKITPYSGRHLRGKVLKTVVRGEIVYQENKPFLSPRGRLLIDNDLLD